MEVSEINAAARGLGMWRKTPAELDALAARYAGKVDHAARVIAEAARQVAAARRAMGVADCGGR